jgi:hypothetical protein
MGGHRKLVCFYSGAAGDEAISIEVRWNRQKEQSTPKLVAVAKHDTLAG